MPSIRFHDIRWLAKHLTSNCFVCSYKSCFIPKSQKSRHDTRKACQASRHPIATRANRAFINRASLWLRGRLVIARKITQTIKRFQGYRGNIWCYVTYVMENKFWRWGGGAEISRMRGLNDATCCIPWWRLNLTYREKASIRAEFRRWMLQI
jgi:hypothetical protein